MSSINQIIDRVADYYAQWNVITKLDEMAFAYWQSNNIDNYQGIYNYKECRSQLRPETFQEIESNYYPPRLTLTEISEIIKDYPFQLPIEVLEIYQRGNGCLPIGSDDSSKNWNSFDNYINFSLIRNGSFLPLSEAMDMYQSLAEKRKYSYSINLRWFPIDCFEDQILAVVGNEEQLKTGSIISFYAGEYLQEVEWSSLTGLLSA